MKKYEVIDKIGDIYTIRNKETQEIEKVDTQTYREGISFNLIENLTILDNISLYEDIKDVDLEKLEEYQYYIYVIENAPQGNIKVGRTGDIKQRLQSLSGSNTGGNKIVKIAVSRKTYLYSLEQSMHIRFNRNRIEGTEWFKDLEFKDVVQYLNDLFNSKSYDFCNDMRKKFVESGGMKYTKSIGLTENKINNVKKKSDNDTKK